jgi:hypothetical protein
MPPSGECSHPIGLVDTMIVVVVVVVIVVVIER